MVLLPDAVLRGLARAGASEFLSFPFRVHVSDSGAVAHLDDRCVHAGRSVWYGPLDSFDGVLCEVCSFASFREAAGVVSLARLVGSFPVPPTLPGLLDVFGVFEWFEVAGSSRAIEWYDRVSVPGLGVFRERLAEMFWGDVAVARSLFSSPLGAEASRTAAVLGAALLLADEACLPGWREVLEEWCLLFRSGASREARSAALELLDPACVGSGATALSALEAGVEAALSAPRSCLAVLSYLPVRSGLSLLVVESCVVAGRSSLPSGGHAQRPRLLLLSEEEFEFLFEAGAVLSEPVVVAPSRPDLLEVAAGVWDPFSAELSAPAAVWDAALLLGVPASS